MSVDSPGARDGSERPEISLVIPAHNEAKYLGKTLDSVMKAREAYRRASLVEVIVVDNCSTDGTAKLAQSLGAEVVSEEERRIASARNAGARASRGNVIGFLDADSRITPNMFNSIEAAMSSSKCIGGGTMIRFDRTSLGLLCTYFITVFPARWLLGVMGGLIFTSKQTFEAMGGFDESLYCAEDSKFALELKRFGQKQGKKFKVITSDYVTTSTRAFDRLGDWYYFRNLPRMLLRGRRAFTEKDFGRKFWYDVDR
jgi:glycosyltransferase involved in cell wall biosynthesis